MLLKWNYLNKSHTTVFNEGREEVDERSKEIKNIIYLLKEGKASIAIESKICRAESIVCGIAENCFNVEEKIDALILE